MSSPEKTWLLKMARAAPMGSMILTVPCCTSVCNRQLSGWYRYTFSLSYFSQIVLVYSKGHYSNLVSNSPGHTQEKIHMYKQASYHTMLSSWSLCELHYMANHKYEQTNEFIQYRRSLLIFSAHEKTVFPSDLWQRSFSLFASTSAHGAIALHAWPLPAKASPWPACSYGKWHAGGEASIMQAWR